MEKAELLAPCGGMEQLKAAIEAGADALYLGGKFFNARMGAGNFDEYELKEAVDYAHLRGVKVYVTLNTLIFDCELKEALEYAAKLYSYNVDALIIQDLGLGKLIRENIPDFELHLSTQATVYNASGAGNAVRMGFKRVVAAREMSLEEIRSMCDVCETEVFVHGAICMCYSGQCQMSRVLGGRSANRGTCAQPCRLPYKDENGNIGYYLSPKDLSYIEHIPELIEAGVRSFKIEGRMKSPEYVAEVTAIFRKYIDLYYSGSTFDVEESDKERLRQIFSRGEFTDGFLSQKTEDILVEEIPKHNGILAGHVVGRGKRKTLRVKLIKPINIGDGVEIRGGKGSKKRICGNIVTFISNLGNHEYIIGDIDGDVRCGDFVFKTSDKGQMQNARKLIRNDTKRIPVRMTFFAHVGKPPVLSAVCGKFNVTVEGTNLVEEAVKSPIKGERVKTQLQKTGGSTFVVESVKIKLIGNCGISVSHINQLRREALNRLKDQITLTRATPSIDFAFLEKADTDLQFEKDCEIDEILPPVTKGKTDKEIESRIKKGEFNNKVVEINNLGWIHELIVSNAKLYAGHGLNITNRMTALALSEMGVKPLRKSYELEENPEILMVTEYKLPEGILSDRRGRKFDIKHEDGKTYIRRV